MDSTTVAYKVLNYHGLNQILITGLSLFWFREQSQTLGQPSVRSFSFTSDR